MSLHAWRRRIGFGGLLFTGLAGLAYAIAAWGTEGLWLGLPFGLFVGLGTAGLVASTRQTTLGFLLTGGFAAVFALGRTVVYGTLDLVAVLLALVATAALYRWRQYRRAA